MVFDESPCARIASAQKTSYPLHDSIRRVNGVCAETSQWVRKKRTGHLLPKQKVHRMRDELLIAREDMLCLGVGSSPFEAVYVELYTTWLVSKMDPVKYIFEKPALTGRIARWQVLLLEFDIVYVTQKGIKGSTLADYLAQQPISDY